MNAVPSVEARRPLLRHRDDCRLCASRRLIKVISLTPTPPANAFVAAGQLADDQPRYPLDVWFCEDCTHVQLLDVVDPDELFRNYVYASGTSPVFVRHFEQYAAEIVRRFDVDPGDLVVDIGSNDGTLLSFFQRSGQRVLGVDPAHDIAQRASAAGIETVCAFLTPALAQDIRARYGPARVVTANNVFAHIDDLSSAVQAVKALLADDGVFVFEVSYLVDVYEQLLFDTVYHEHLDYHSVRPLIPFLAAHGLTLVDATRVPSHGGSLRAVAALAGSSSHSASDAIAALVRHEDALGLNNADTLRRYGARIDQRAAELRALLTSLRADGRRIVGFGAPAKATTLMHHFGVDGLIDCIVDDSPLKQGLYTPGLHIPVVPPTALYDSPPDYVLILAWNFAPSIMANHQRFADGGGRFIVPLPELQIR